MSRDIHRRYVEPPHGPKDFYYSTLPDGELHPVIECLCGWTPSMIHDTWGGVGVAFDIHIAALRRKGERIATRRQGR